MVDTRRIGKVLPTVTKHSLNLRQKNDGSYKWVVEKVTTTTDAVEFDNGADASEYFATLVPREGL